MTGSHIISNGNRSAIKRSLIMLMAMSTFGGIVRAQEVIFNGDFSAGSTGWTTWRASGASTIRSFISTLVPTGGTPPCFAVSTTSFTTGAIGGAWQPLNLVPGTQYTLSILCKNNNPEGYLTMAKALVGNAREPASVEGQSRGSRRGFRRNNSEGFCV